MKRCPRCKAVLEPDVDQCPLCGVKIKRKSARPTQDNEMLKKDKWSFTEVENTTQISKPVVATKASEDSKKEEPIATEIRRGQFGKTIAMAAIDPTAMGQQKKVPKNAERAVRPRGTVAFETPIAKSELDNIALEKTIQGRKAISGAHLTVPLQLGTEPSTQIRIPIKADKKQPRMTAPIPLTNEVETRAKIPKEEVRGDSDFGIKTAPFEPQVYVESDSKRQRATAPFEIATPLCASDSRRGRSPVSARMGSAGRKSSWSFWLAIASVILVGTWFIPSVLVAPLVFPMELISTVKGLDLVALVTVPFVGAIVMTLIIAPMNPKLRASVVLILGLTSLAVPLLLGVPALPLPGYIVFLVVLAAAGASLVIQMQTAKSVLGHIALALLPATFIAVALYGFYTARLPMANIVVLKDPLIVYAGMLLVAVSAEELLS